MDEQTTQPVEGSVKEFEVPATSDIYVGKSKVTPVTLPNGLISVQLPGFEEGDFIEMKMTAEQWEYVKSNTPYPDGDASSRKWKITIAKILTILTQDNLQMNDREYVIQAINEKILENRSEAIAKVLNLGNLGEFTMQQIIDIISPKV